MVGGVLHKGRFVRGCDEVIRWTCSGFVHDDRRKMERAGGFEPPVYGFTWLGFRQ